MHYYVFNIGDYITGTHYFTNDQDLAYRRLLDLYYANEKPIDNETQSVSSRIRMGSQTDAVEFVLREKFVLMDDNKWHHVVCDANILKYQGKCNTNKINGIGGGRPKKNPVGFQKKPSRNPNQEPRTNNQEPINNPPTPQGGSVSRTFERGVKNGKPEKSKWIAEGERLAAMYLKRAMEERGEGVPEPHT